MLQHDHYNSGNFILNAVSKAPLVCFLVFVIFVSAIEMLPHTLTSDERAVLNLSQHLCLEYPKPPSLYYWLQYFIFQLMGPNIFACYLLHGSLLLLLMIFWHKICTIQFKKPNIQWAVFLSLFLFPVFWQLIFEFKHHSLLTATSCMLTYWWLIRKSSLGATQWSVIFGICLAVGLLAKFSYVLFLIPLLLTAQIIRYNPIKPTQLLIGLSVAFGLTSPYYYYAPPPPLL